MLANNVSIPYMVVAPSYTVLILASHFRGFKCN